MAENKSSSVSEGPSRWAHFFTEKADKIKYLIIALVVVAVAAVVIVSSQRRSANTRAAEAGNAVFQSMIDMTSKPENESAAAFAKAADQYAGLPAGAQARMIEFSMLYRENDYAGAERAARDFLKAYPQNPMRLRAQMALGQSLVMQNKLPEAIAAFRQVVATGDAGLMPEAKLALAQSLELNAEAVKDDPVQYRSRLEEAMAEYTDILSRAGNPMAQRSYWPQTVVLPADFALTVVKDKLAGHDLHTKLSLRPPAETSDELRAVMAASMPAAEDAAETPAAPEPEADSPATEAEE